MKRIPVLLLIAVLASFTVIPISFAGDGDSRYRDDSTSVFAPGWNNAAKYQAEVVRNQNASKKSMFEKIIESVNDRTQDKVKERTIDKPRPELKQKQSSSGGSRTAASAIVTKVGDSSQYNLPISGGKVQKEEVINGIRHLFVGFENGGYARTDLQKVINQEAGKNSIIILRGDTTYSGATLVSGIKIYGGYDINGNRDLASHASVITDTVTLNNVSNVEINGITFNRASGFNVTVNNSSNISILYNTFNNSASGTTLTTGTPVVQGGISINSSLSSSSVTLTNNTFNSPDTGIYVTGQLTQLSGGVLPGGAGGGIIPGGGLGGGQLPGGGGLGGGIAPPTITGYISYVTSQYNNYNTNTGIAATGVSNISSNGDYFKSTPETYRINERYVTTLPNYSQNNTSPAYNLNRSYNAILIPDFAPGTSYSLTNNPYLSTYASPQSILMSIKDGSNDAFYRTGADYALSGNLLTGRDGKILAKIIENNLSPAVGDRIASPNSYALAIPIMRGDNLMRGDMEAAARLADILKNPTEDQKLIIDTIKAILMDAKNLEDKSGNQSPELKKASDDLLQVVANLLLAQGIPDLLKQGDVSNVRAIFFELDDVKNKIMLEYAKSTRPYYENILKDLAKNMAMLREKNLLNSNMTKDELSKLPPSELDKILEKIKNMKDKTFEEQYILQQEAKYRKEYLDPGKQKLEEDMKWMLRDFTGKISDALKSAEKK